MSFAKMLAAMPSYKEDTMTGKFAKITTRGHCGFGQIGKIVGSSSASYVLDEEVWDFFISPYGPSFLVKESDVSFELTKEELESLNKKIWVIYRGR